MGTLDIIIVVFCGLLLLLGFKKGITKQLFSIGAWLIAFAASFFFAIPALIIFLGEQENISLSTQAIAYISVFLIVFIMIKLIGRAMSKSAKKSVLGIFDRLLGGAWGLAKGLIIISLLLLLMRTVITLPFIGEPILAFITEDMQLESEGFGIAKYLYENNLVLLIIDRFVK